MPYRLLLAAALKKAGWKVKIHDAERLEPPHITIYRKMDKWRYSLRDKDFLDKGHKWSQVDEEVRKAIEANWDLLIREWDKIHGDNPVTESEDNA